MLSINTNISAMFAANDFNQTSLRLDNVTKQLASGKRIITAADDPAGVGILSNMRGDRASYEAVMKNIDSGLSLLNVSSSSLAGQQDILTQMKGLATTAASDLLTADQRDAVQSQFAELQTQLDNIVNEANLFGQNLTGTAAADVDIQVGLNAGSKYTLTSSVSDGATLLIDAGAVDLTDAVNATAAMTALDDAISAVAVSQTTIGTQETGLNSLRRISETTSDNLKSAMSRIEDANIPDLSTELAQLQAKMQLQTQMLGISNSIPNILLQMLR